MTLNYQLSDMDFLAYQRYASSRSKVYSMRRIRFRRILTLVYIGFALFAYFMNKNVILSLIFFAIAIIWYLCYPIYLKWSYERHFRKQIQKQHKEYINKQVEIQLGENSIKVKDATDENTINANELKEVVETKDYFFIVSRTEMALIVPKESFRNFARFKKIITGFGVPYLNELNWRWK